MGVMLSTLLEAVLAIKSYHVVLAFMVWVLYKVVHQLILWPRYLSPLRDIPGPPLGSVIKGQFPAILEAEAGILQREWVKEYGPIVRAVGPVGIERLIFCKPEALHKILVSDWVECPRPDFLRHVLGSVAGHGLLTVTGNEHKAMRKVMNPAFSIQHLTNQTDMYYDSIQTLVNILKVEINEQVDPSKGKEFLMYEWSSKVALDIICETAFGYKTDSLRTPHNPLAVAYEDIIGLQSGSNLARFIVMLSIPGTTSLIASKWLYDHRRWLDKIAIFGPLSTLVDSMYRIKNISAEILAEKMRESAAVAATDDLAKRDIMSILVRARMSEKGGGYQMSDQAMMQQVLTFLGAGHETTASGLAWTLWLLASHPKAQLKLREEVVPLLANNPRPDYRTLTKDMQYLDAVIQESLRILPPVPMTFRKASQDTHIDGVFVPKETLFYIPIRVFNTWKEIWGDDAEEFVPERWLSKASLPSSLTFIHGPHHCIGKTMAIVEMKAIIAHLAANFEFLPAHDGQVIRPTAAVTMKPQDNMPLILKALRN